MLDTPPSTDARKAWLSTLARAPQGRAGALFAALGLDPDFDTLRAPEIGSVMVRGRAGGTGAAFNLGEMTVTRCSVKLACGAVGHGYVQGRRKTDAETAALIDALMQTGARADLQTRVIDRLDAEARDRHTARAARAAATKVDFFTMARGED